MRWLKLLWINIALIMVVATASASEMNGFRDFTWGSDIKNMQETDPQLVEGHMGVVLGVKAYQRSDEDLDFGGIKADGITYTFFNDKFTSVSIDFRGIYNFEKLLNYCKKTYGPVTGTVVVGLEQYAGFDTPKTGAMLLYQLSMQGTNYGRLYIYSKELMK